MPDDQTSTSRPAAAAEAQSEPDKDLAHAASRQEHRRRLRLRLFAGLGAVVVIAILGWGVWWLLVGSHYVSTDDAYVGAEVAEITPRVSGTVQGVYVSDTQQVKAGQVLVKLDPSDARLALQRAQAQYGQAVRQVRQLFATDTSSTAQVAARQADLARAGAQLMASQADLQRARVDLTRRQNLAASGAVSGEELTTARNAFATAQANVAASQAGLKQAEANLAAARAQLAAQTALTAGSTVETNPQVAAARAALDSARLDLERTVITSPIDGVVARRQAQVGERVQLGATMMDVVPVDQAYVDANFKEVQLRKVRVGQPAVVHADIYGGGVTYRGVVQGIGGGTGSAFSVIPAQNATGNWIKVVQRLPVRIRLDPRELRAHPLRVGLSTKVKIDVAHRGR
jgi:membrane fusion protein (multidrug efflux system)